MSLNDGSMDHSSFFGDYLMKKLTGLAMALMLGISSVAMAKVVNLYDQPKVDSKVITTVETKNGVIVIYTPKDTEWVKVADPKNGNVGWVKSADLGGVGMHVNVMQTGDGGTGYQVIQYSGPTVLTKEQIATMTKQMQMRQQMIQQDMNKMVTDIYNNIRENWGTTMPGIMMPESSGAQPVKAGAPK